VRVTYNYPPVQTLMCGAEVDDDLKIALVIAAIESHKVSKMKKKEDEEK